VPKDILDEEFLKIAENLTEEEQEEVMRKSAKLKTILTSKERISKVAKDIAEHFQNPDTPPKILIVTNMLLTGFDAPIERVMYLDKPLRDHNLLQAIARTHRPYLGKATPHPR